MSTVVDLGGLGPRGFVIDGDLAGDEAGWSVSSAGDVNGDGFDDIIIGAPFADLGSVDRGAAYVIYGRPGGFGAMNLSNLQPGQGFAVQGSTAGDFQTGMSVSSAGDVNGDGFDDLVVAATRRAGSYGNIPQAYVIYGSPGRSGTVDLTNFPSSDGFYIKGGFENTYYGFDHVSVSSAGDFNGDGFDDVLVGTPYAGNYNGAAYVVWGKPSGLGIVDLSALAAGDGFTIRGGSGDQVGWSVSSAGDVNGDGLDDIVIGAVGADGGGNNAGAAYVIFGKTSGFGTIDLANLSTTAGFVIQGDATFDSAGSSVSSAGDVNHDGFDDIIIGAPGSDTRGSDAGAAYIIFGKANGFGPIDLSNLGTAGITIQGAAAGDSMGNVSAAGDVNHDGFADVILGAVGNDTAATDSGRAYVIFGKANLAGTIDLTNLDPAAGFIISDPIASSFAGFSVSGGGDVNHDGFSDVLVGVPFVGTSQGQVYVISGNATLADIDNDFNGDGRSDFLLRNDNGAMTDWLAQAGGGFASNSANFQITASADWHVLGAGDFNGDGREDILWRSDAGTVTNWLGTANGAFSNNFANFAIHADANWQIIGTGDFNGDGRDDILWRSSDGTITDSLGTANGSFSSNSGNFTIHATADWQIIGTGDFNGDGRDDILWRSNTGMISEWIGVDNGALVDNGAHFTTHADANWHIIGTGDFNGDGRQDLLWRSDAGQVTDWLGTASGGFTNNGSNFLIHADANWQIVGIGDFNGDRRDDLLWRSDAGQISDWFGQASGAIVPTVQNFNAPLAASWHVQDSFL